MSELPPARTDEVRKLCKGCGSYFTPPKGPGAHAYCAECKAAGLGAPHRRPKKAARRPREDTVKTRRRNGAHEPTKTGAWVARSIAEIDKEIERLQTVKTKIEEIRDLLATLPG